MATARRTSRARQAGIAALAAVVVTLAAVVAVDLTSNTPQPLPAAVQEAPEGPQILGQTDLQETLAALGPFETIAVPTSDTPDTEFPALLLLRQDGSVAASKNWTLSYTPTSWAQQDTFQISKLQVRGKYATLQSAGGRVYTVRTGQPFLLEGFPQHVLLVTDDGQQWSIPSSRAHILRRSL